MSSAVFLEMCKYSTCKFFCSASRTFLVKNKNKKNEYEAKRVNSIRNVGRTTMQRRSTRATSTLLTQSVCIKAVNHHAELAYQKMLKDKKDDASLHIPKDFGEFVQKKEFKKLL